MKFSQKKTCNTCRGDLGLQGCLFGVEVKQVSEFERVPLEPCKKPVTNADMNELCESGGFESDLTIWRGKVD